MSHTITLAEFIERSHMGGEDYNPEFDSNSFISFAKVLSEHDTARRIQQWSRDAAKPAPCMDFSDPGSTRVCKNYVRCATEKLACEAYYWYLWKPHPRFWADAPRHPCKKIMDLCENNVDPDYAEIPRFG